MWLATLCFWKAWRVNSTSSGLSSTSRIWTDCSTTGNCSFESKEECRALVDGPFRPDAPAVAVDDAVNDGQADTGSLIVLGAMQALEDAEKFVGVLHVEPHPVVLDEVRGGAVLLLAAHRDDRQFLLACVLERVGY